MNSYKTLQFSTRTICCREIVAELNTWGAKGYKVKNNYIQFGLENEEQIQIFMYKQNNCKDTSNKTEEIDVSSGCCSTKPQETGCCMSSSPSIKKDYVVEDQDFSCCSNGDSDKSGDSCCQEDTEGTESINVNKYIYDVSSFATEDVSKEMIEKELNDYGHAGFKFKFSFTFIKKNEHRIRYVVMKKK